MGGLTGNISFLNDEEIEMIHQNSLKILSEIGFKIPNNEILSLLEKNGCSINYETQKAKVDPILTEDVIKKIPKNFSIIPTLKKNKICFRTYPHQSWSC